MGPNLFGLLDRLLHLYLFRVLGQRYQSQFQVRAGSTNFLIEQSASPLPRGRGAIDSSLWRQQQGVDPRGNLISGPNQSGFNAVAHSPLDTWFDYPCFPATLFAWSHRGRPAHNDALARNEEATWPLTILCAKPVLALEHRLLPQESRICFPDHGAQMVSPQRTEFFLGDDLDFIGASVSFLSAPRWIPMAVPPRTVCTS